MGNLLVEGVLVAQLVPHAGLTSNHIHVGDSGLELVHLPPVLVDSVSIAVEITEANVEVGEVVVGEDNFVFPACHAVDISAHTPPLDDVLVLHWNIDVFICPVDHFLLGRNSPPKLFLPLPEVN